MHKNIKILVGYHKPAYLLKNEDNIFIPIHLGSKLSGTQNKDGVISSKDQKWLAYNTIRDDTGDNISERNHEYCELTGLYWAWKNYDKIDNPDIFGFMHYRRQFILSSNYQRKHTADFCHLVRRDYPGDKYECEIGLDLIKSLALNNKVFVCSNELDISPGEYHRSQPFIQKEAYDRAIEILKINYPEISHLLDKYLNGSVHYWSNMFIAERKVFFDLCEWLFPKLDLVYKNIDITNWTISEKRFIGYLAENLFGVYWESLKISGVTVESLPVSFLDNTDIKVNVQRGKANEIPIVLSSNKQYIKYAAVTIQSIVENSNPQNAYRIVILENGVDESSKRKINDIISTRSNFELDFINIRPYTAPFTELFSSGKAFHYSPDIFNRYFIPEILKEYDKAIYLDCDIVVTSDIAELYNTQLSNFSIGAVKDIERRRWLKLDDRKEYIRNFDSQLGIKDSYQYFNSGVLVINIKDWIQNERFQQIIKLTKATKSNSTNWYGDQDILNGIFYGKVKFIDYSWNVMWVVANRISDWTTQLDADSVAIYKKSLDAAKIIHYCDGEKPWNFPELPLSSIWWRYARKTPFYEEFLFNLIKTSTAKSSDIQKSSPIKFKKISNDHDLFKARIKVLKFKIARVFRRGLKRIHYNDKIRILSSEIAEYTQSKNGR